MAELREKQFELDGVVFGLYAPITVSDWQPGSPALRSNDVDNPVGDGVRMGRTIRGATTWNFSLSVDGSDEDDGWAILARLAKAWDGDWVHAEPDRVVPLRYRVAGQTRVVYGQPRQWTPVVNNLSMLGRIDVEAQFVLVDHRSYADTTQSEPLTLGIPLDLEAGHTVPTIVPWTSSAGDSRQESAITIGGDVETPVWVTFFGPVDNAAIRVGGWTAQMAEHVYYADPVTIDGRPWVRTATKQSGGGSRVNPRFTRMSKMWLPPGHHEVTFTGEDLTGTATALVSWRDAFRTPR